MLWRTFGVVLVLAAAARVRADDDMAELMKMLRDNCIEESEVDPALIDQVNSGGELVPDPKLKCYTKCIVETAGVFADGELDVEAMISMLPDSMKHTEKYIRACGSPQGADECDTAFLIQRCWKEHAKDQYMLV